MLIEEYNEINTNPTASDLRKYGFVMTVGFAVIAAVSMWQDKAWYIYLWYASGAFCAVGIIAPKLLKYVYIGWMALAMTIGFFVSKIILSFLFYFIITGIHFAAFVFRKKLLWHAPKGPDTYWIAKPDDNKDIKRCEKQY